MVKIVLCFNSKFPYPSARGKALVMRRNYKLWGLGTGALAVALAGVTWQPADHQPQIGTDRGLFATISSSDFGSDQASVRRVQIAVFGTAVTLLVGLFYVLNVRRKTAQPKDKTRTL